jgi:hypothetical protein
MLKFINGISNGVHYVKKVGAFFACFAAAAKAWHDEWVNHFPTVEKPEDK